MNRREFELSGNEKSYMNKYIKIRYRNKISSWLLFVDKNYEWDPEQIKHENLKAAEMAKMAFLDHGQLNVNLSLPDFLQIKASYINRPQDDTILLITEGGNFMTLVPGMEILETTYSKYYPIKKSAAIVCENDPFDKWGGGLDYVFYSMTKIIGIDDFHYMFSFRNRMESEIIEAFKNTPAILFCSTHTEVDWWELMLRCIIKSKTKAKIMGKRNSECGKRFDKCIEMAEKFDISISVV